MDLIHASCDFRELGVIDYIRFDGVISPDADLDSNDWEVELYADDFARYGISLGDYLYFTDTEWGGVVEKIQHLSAKRTMKISGPNWRGMLARKVIEPPPGTSHLVLTDVELHTAIGMLTQDFGGMVQASVEDTGKRCTRKFRYQTVLEGIHDMLGEAGCRLAVRLDADSKLVILSAEEIADHSEEVEFSEDYDMTFTSTLGDARYNHVIALGSGEQEDRMVRHVWLLPDGSITDDSQAQGIPTGLQNKVLVYDYPNCEDEAELISGAKKKLKENAEQNAIDFDFDTAVLDLPLGDKVGMRDRLIGLSDVKTITRKLLTISSDGTTLQYSVE